MLTTSPITSTNVAANPATILACSSPSAPNIKPTVLLVEDDNYVSATIWTLLKHSDFDVAVAECGVDGFKLARTLTPDIVVLDVNLPDMNGLEICRRLKADPGTSAIPIVFLSGRSEYAQTALDLGGEEFLVKPLGICQLPKCLSQILAKRAAAQNHESFAQAVGL